MKSLTPSEKAALYFQVLESVQDWKIIYRIAIGEKHAKSLKDSTIQANTSKWKESDRIRNALDEIKRYFYFKRQDLEKEIKESISNGETETENGTKKEENAGKTNFLDRDEFLKFLNDRANKITDDKLRNDILKMLSDNLRYKDSDNNELQEIQRFYTPMNCENCEIYNKCKSCTLSECVKVEK